MSHHGRKPSELPEAIRQILNQPLIGATGQYPAGWLNKDDEGGIQFAIGGKDGKVVLDFGQPVVWVGMTPGEALEMAQTLIKHARAVAKGSSSILTLNL